MKIIFYLTFLMSFLFGSGDFKTRIILFLIFIALALVGYKFMTLRTGNYDIDFFTKILGWILLIPGILGLMESLLIIQ